uniref:LEM domain-containing protein n=1 Tax=Xiphophorus couchianus TaxID=32473 RepID=A0A3B5L3Z1_9TELE
MDCNNGRLARQLCVAVNDGDTRSVQLFLSKGANPNLVGSKGVAAIHLAVGNETEKNIRCLKMLLRHGSDPNVRSSEGLTPLHVAALWGCYQILKMLLMNGGNPNLKDNDGNTPAQLAEQQDNWKCASLLHEYQSSADTEEEDLPQFQYCKICYLVADCFKNCGLCGVFFPVVSSVTPPGPQARLRAAAEAHTAQSAVHARPVATMAAPENDALSCDDGTVTKDNEQAASANAPSEFLSRRASRKSVSFRKVDDYFPVFSPETRKQSTSVEISQRTLPFDMSEYSDFLDSERMATVLPQQGIDVTSPDHVFVFSRESSESTEEELEKTVISHCALELSDDEPEGSSSGTRSSHYSSCESDQYTSCLDAPVPLRHHSFPLIEESEVQTEPNGDSKSETVQPLSEEINGLQFTPSPFVTGRTRSRLSRCSMRTSRNPESMLITSSLFDNTLPTPVRMFRQTPRCQSSGGQNSHLSEDEEFLTEALPGSDESKVAHLAVEDQVDDFKNDDCWVTEDYGSESNSASSSSTSSSFSPKTSTEDTDPPRTPGTGCTPRYSMSRLSSHRPQRLNLDEPVEYLYTDTEQGHKLIETHVPPTSDTSLSSGTSTSKENLQELRLRLVELGESPGPISSLTRPTYLRKLCRLLQEENYLGYSPDLCRVLKTFQLPNSHGDEQSLCQQFDQPDQNRKWREGIIKSSFNYLLLDPRVTKNLPFRSHTMTPQECFQTFIHAIFYVGKGKRSRPYSHLYEALEYYRGEKSAKKLCPKVQHILQVWTAGQGVISLHCFQNVIPVEAYTREACMVEAIGLKMLTNQKRGDFYGVVSNWELKRKRELGIHLLYRAMRIFLAEGERQLRPADIRQ